MPQRYFLLSFWGWRILMSIVCQINSLFVILILGLEKTTLKQTSKVCDANGIALFATEKCIFVNFDFSTMTNIEHGTYTQYTLFSFLKEC